jgi:hypothetical protein
LEYPKPDTKRRFDSHHSLVLEAVGRTVAIISADRKQARTIVRYLKAFFAVPMLKRMVVSETTESITLNNNVILEVHTASFRSVRGYTLLAVIADEIAFWRSEDSANPDKEIVGAVRPGLATTNGLLLCISSPYARRGAMWEAYQRHYGKDSKVLVWQATSREMNPALSQAVVDQAMEEDPIAAAAEYGAEFRKDIESFVDAQLIRRLVVPGRVELPYQSGIRYFGFVDPAGGSGQDSYTLAIGHQEPNGIAVVDCLREVRPPFSPEGTTKEFAATLTA